MKCSFAKIPLGGTFTPVWPFGTELYGRFLYLEKGTEKALICAFDFLGTFHTEARRWREEVSKATGIDEKSIWYHELQVHAAPESEALSGEAMDRIIERTVSAVKDMMARADEFDLYACEADFGTECTFNREQYVEGLGGVTVWTGMEFDAEGRPYSQDKNIMLLRGYQPDLPVFDKPIYFDNPNDPKAYLFVFKDKNGKVIGTVSRFAAHPDVAVLFELRFHPDRRTMYHYNFDWPGYMSEDFEREYGGISMYLNGPCADLSTKKSNKYDATYEDSDADCRRLAEWFGGKLKKAFDETAFKVDTEQDFATETFRVSVPMKDDIPYGREEPEYWQKRANDTENALQQAIAENRPAYEIKHLIDERWRASQLQHIATYKTGFTDEELEKHEVEIDIAVMKFAGYLFVGVPGESLVDMTLWLRSEFTGAKTIPVDQVGGYFNYMATPRSLTLGGYTYWSSWVSRESIPTLKRKIYPLIDDFNKNR